MRFGSLAVLCAVFAVASSAGAVELLTVGQASEQLPDLTVLASDEKRILVEFEMPEVVGERVAIGDEEFTLLSIPGGGLEGAVGAPAVPMCSRLMQIPDDVAVSIRVKSVNEELLTGLRLVPMQQEDGESVGFDAVAYSRTPAVEAPLVSAGRPAIMRHVRVVPLTFRPVHYDPVGQTARIADRIQVELTFDDAGASVNARPTLRGAISPSFDRLYRETIANYSPPPMAERSTPGTYLLICPDDSGVLSRLDPLVEWRTRKGMPTYLATTSETGTSASSIKDFIQDAYDTWAVPPEHVVFVGDANGSYDIATWYETLSGYSGEGDHPYTQLDGDDPLADIHVGRLSISTLNELELIVNKIIGYESTPHMDDPGWFTRGCVVGDPGASGYSTVLSNQWVKERLLQIGYAEVDTVWTEPFVTQMRTALNRGDTVFSYRGYLGMSGWTNSNTSQLTNGWKMPFAVVLTCDTGSFSDGTCRSEGFLRAGAAPSSPKGGIGSIGTATWGTHTRYNNCILYGVFRGLLWEGQHEMGAALTRGKLEMYLNYQPTHPTEVLIWSHWNNLMGDSAVDIFTGYPTAITVDHTTQVPIGSNSLMVNVMGLMPVEGALVCAWKGEETYAVGYTDANGDVELPIDAATAGDMLLTVTKHNHHPYLVTIPVAAEDVFVGYESSTVDDDDTGSSSGDGDGIVNPGETVELPVQLRNTGSMGAPDVTATLTTLDPYVTIVDGSETFGSIAAGGSAWSADDFDFDVDLGCPNGHTIRFGLDAASGQDEWHSLIDVAVVAADLVTDATTLYGAGGNGVVDPGETVDISVRLRNDGGKSADDVSGTLMTASQFVTITDDTGMFGSIPASGTGENTIDRFTISVDPGTYNGHLANFMVATEFSSGVTDTAFFVLTIGQVSSTDPLGPDAYGYFAFDDTDTDYGEVPVYDWIEIDPAYGGAGSEVVLGDNGTYQDKSRVVDLPFTFNYYGESYTRATICSNGWIAMGETYLTVYRNWTIPGAGGPAAMIAVFWDDLREVSGGKVYQLYDETQHRWIVEYSRMKNEQGREQVCQAIFLDPAHHPTSTGDGEIILQYHTVNNYDPVDGYATVGIESPDQSDGILYTFFDQYPDGAATLQAGRAIRFMPAQFLPMGQLGGDVTNASYGGAPIPGAQVKLLELDRAFFTGPDGSYLGSAPEGTYDVAVEHVSFEPDTAYDVNVVVSELTKLDFSLTDIAPPTVTTTPHPSTSDTVGPYAISVQIVEYSGLDAASLFYRVNGSADAEAVLVYQGGNLYIGEIPGQSYETLVEYYVHARDVLGYESFDPPGAPAARYSFVVAPEMELLNDDFEVDNGWTVGAADDDAIDGIWDRLDPRGTEYNGYPVQPEDDHTDDPGVLCFVTANDDPGDAAGAADVDRGKTTLRSPMFDLSGFTASRIEYWVWYTNNRGNNPGQDYWDVDVTNDGLNWIHLEHTLESTNDWVYRSFALHDYLEMTSQVQIQFVAQDYLPGSLVEAAVDDFLLTAIDEAVGVEAEIMTGRVGLDANRPNPFNPSTMITYRVSETVPVKLVLYDVSGRRVITLVDDVVTAGEHGVRWDGHDAGGLPVGSGVYFVRLEAPGFMQVRQLTLLR